MFRDEHGASIEGADEEVCRVGGTWIGLDILTRSNVTVSKERRVGECRERAVELCMQEGVCLDGCMFVLMCGRVEDEQSSGPTSEREGRRGGSTDRGE